MKKFNKSTAIILSVVMFVCLVVGFIVNFVPIKFSKSKFVSIWNTINVSSDMTGGIYGEYDILTENPSENDVIQTVSIIRNVFEKDGYKNVNVYAVGKSKVRVELSYPNGDESIGTAYNKLLNIGTGAFSLSSASTTTEAGAVVLEGAKYVKEVKVYTNNSEKYISVVFNKAGKVKFEELCKKTESIYLILGDYNQSISITGIADYSSLTLSNTDWDNMIALEQKIQFGCTKVELDGANAKIDTMSTTLSAGESSSSPEHKSFFSSNIYVIAMAGIIVVAVLILAFFAIKYGLFAIITLISMLVNVYLFLFIAWLVPSFELGVSVVIAIAIGLTLIYSYAYSFAKSVKGEYNLGKSLAASLESSYKKTILNVVISNLVLFVSSLILTMLSFGEISSVAIAFTIISALSLFTNLCLIPLLIKIGISFDGVGRKLFLLKKKRSLSELSSDIDNQTQKEDN